VKLFGGNKVGNLIFLLPPRILSEVTNTPQFFETFATTSIYLTTQCNVLKELNLFQHPSGNFNTSHKFTFRSVENDKLCAFYVASCRLQPCLRPSYVVIKRSSRASHMKGAVTFAWYGSIRARECSMLELFIPHSGKD
jgi:hypothetical protein